MKAQRKSLDKLLEKREKGEKRHGDKKKRKKPSHAC
jgi:hypothetical protein